MRLKACKKHNFRAQPNYVKSMKHIILKHGLFGVLVLIVFNLVFFFTIPRSPEYYSFGELAGYTTIILSLSFVIFGMYEYGKKYNDVRFGKFLLVGLLITILPALAFGIYNIVYVEYLDPEFMDKYYAQMVTEAQEQYQGAELTKALEELQYQKETFVNPYMQFFVMFMTVYLIGFIISFIGAMFLNYKHKTTTQITHGTQ